jgi:hypothetical protein
VHRQCRRSMNIHDKLPAVVRSAVHESDFYTEPETASLLVKFYGPKAAARLILKGQQDVSLRCFLAYFFGHHPPLNSDDQGSECTRFPCWRF